MGALVRAELLKYTSTRMAWAMALAMALSGAALAAVTAAFLLYGSLQVGGGELDLTALLPDLAFARMVYTAGIQFGYLLALVIGVVLIGQEIRHKTASATFLAEPRRSRVVVAKALALVVIAVTTGLLHALGAFAGGAVLLGLNDLAVLPEPAQIARTLALEVLVITLWALIGLGTGLVVTNQVAALFLAVAIAMIIEPLLGLLLTFRDGGEAVARFFPSQATTATLDVFTGVDASVAQALGSTGDLLPWWGGGLTLLGYALLLTLLGGGLTQRRDVL